jgi:hypothetical protein
LVRPLMQRHQGMAVSPFLFSPKMEKVSVRLNLEYQLTRKLN